MKKILLSMLSLLVSMTMFAQSEAVRKMNLVYDGQVVYSRSVSLIDSIKFVWEETGDDVIGGGEVDGTKQLYVGVVAFNQNVRQMPITSDVEAVKAFINEQTNDKDFTSFAYSVSKGNQMFDAEALPAFDKIFMLNFSDGTDNYSNMKWGEEGRMVSQRNVYDTARYDLQQRNGLNSYALGFGNDVGFGANMKKVVMGSGSYFNVTSANELQSTFNEIAKSMLASAKNVLLKTNPGYYVGGDCKYFRFTFTAEGGYTDTIYAQMEGYPAVGYTLTISKVSNNYAYFDAPAKGVVDNETGKVHIPLNNLKFTKDGEELQYKFVIEVSFDGELYYEDVEEASTAEEIDKRIAVVLVLDCSTSMGDAFAPMKAAAVNFIETMEKMEVDDSEPNIPDVPNTGNHEYVDLGLSVKWATCNVGASKPEEYGDYFAWGEVEPKDEYRWETYKWCDGQANTLTKYNTDSSYGTVDNKTVLEAADDAATVNWGGSWRMPTDVEMTELYENCTWTWTTENGVNGYRVTSNKIGYTDKSIFLPAAGFCANNNSYAEVGSNGSYWSSSLTNTALRAYAMDLYADKVYSPTTGTRRNGYSIRPVCQ
jgi:hypothetical protein